MANIEIILTHFILSPIFYYLFGRPRITRAQLDEARQNLNQILGTLRGARTSMRIVPWSVQPAWLQEQAKQLYKELESDIKTVCSESSAIWHFWQLYDGILSRKRLTDDQIQLGKSRFEFWLDGNARRMDAELKKEKVSVIDDMAKSHCRQQLASGRLRLRR